VLGTLGTQVGTAAAHPRHHHGHNAFKQVNLVSDIPGRATIHDPAVKNPWGIAFGPKSSPTPLWVNNQFNPNFPVDLTTKITLYAGANGKDKIAKVPLEVEASSPTGIVFNGGNAFKINQHNGDGRVPAKFMFNEAVASASSGSEPVPNGRITGWAPGSTPDRNPLKTTVTRARQNGQFPTGLALVPGTHAHGPRLLVASAPDGTIRVYNSHFGEITRHGRFLDKRASAKGLAAYNVTFLKGHVYVSYAPAPDSKATGFAVTRFDVNGGSRKRLVTNGHLNDPWGMAIAPKHWGRFGGDLLVGNVDDGMINAFNRHNGHFEGTLKNAHGKPLVNPGLWGIAFGNGVIGTPRTLIFAAGIGSEAGGFGDDVYAHGLVGLIRPAKHHHHN